MNCPLVAVWLCGINSNKDARLKVGRYKEGSELLLVK